MASSLPSPTLQRLLDAAKVAGPYERIDWRDPIASHGQEAIDAVAPWLVDRVLAAFAVRVVLRVGEHGDREEAFKVLRKARTKVPLVVRTDVDAALRQLSSAPMPGQSRPALGPPSRSTGST